MEFRDLKAQYRFNKEAIDNAVMEAIAAGTFIGGAAVSELEEQLANYVGVDYCISCANGTDALQLALMAWGISAGDAVFVPDFTFFSTAEVVSLCGATPVFVDVDAETFNMSPASLENAIQYVEQHTSLAPKVVIPVDLFGLPADFPTLKQLAEKYGLKVLEDGAQGFGGKIGGQRACSFGEIATTSFFPAKPLGCYGDGGAVFTRDKATKELLASLKVHGKGRDKYDNIRIGMNSRLDTLQAAILSVKLKLFQTDELEQVNQAAMWYTQGLQSIMGIRTPRVPANRYSGWAQYTVVFQEGKLRDAAQQYLKEKGIPSMIYYRKPLHLQEAFAEVGKNAVCPVTERLCETVLSLPIHPYLSREEITGVCELLRKFMEESQ